MSRDWEQTLSCWGGAPGATEQTKAENAERAPMNPKEIKEEYCYQPRLRPPQCRRVVKINGLAAEPGQPKLSREATQC